jgi:hypothetical protein
MARSRRDDGRLPGREVPGGTHRTREGKVRGEDGRSSSC